MPAETEAPVSAPAPTAKPPRAAKPETTAQRFHAIIAAIPAIALGIGFWALIFHQVPTDNKEIVLSISSGLLGYLTHAAQTRAAGKAPQSDDAA